MSIKEIATQICGKLASGAKLYVLQIVEETEAKIPGATGAEKRAYAVNRLDELVRLPWYLEPFDAPLFGLLIDAACDKLNLLNDTHDWEPLSAEQQKEVAAVLDTPKAVAEKITAAADNVSDRIEELYKQYGIKK